MLEQRSSHQSRPTALFHARLIVRWVSSYFGIGSELIILLLSKFINPLLFILLGSFKANLNI